MKRAFIILLIVIVMALCYIAVLGIGIFCNSNNAMADVTPTDTDIVKYFLIDANCHINADDYITSAVAIFMVAFLYIFFFAIMSLSNKIRICKWLCILVVCSVTFISIVFFRSDTVYYRFIQRIINDVENGFFSNHSSYLGVVDPEPTGVHLLFLTIPCVAFLCAKYKRLTLSTGFLIVCTTLFPAVIMLIFHVYDGMNVLVVFILSLLGILFVLSKDDRFPKRLFYFFLITCICAAIFVVKFDPFKYHESYEYATDEMKSLLRKTPFVGETLSYIEYYPSISATTFIASLGLDFIPIALLARFGWLAFLILVLAEIYIVFILIYCGYHSGSSFGKYICCFSAMHFSARIVLYFISVFFFRLIDVFLPFQGDALSVAIDIVLMAMSLFIADEKEPKRVQLMDFDSSLQTSFLGFMKLIVTFITGAFQPIKKQNSIPILAGETTPQKKQSINFKNERYYQATSSRKELSVNKKCNQHKKKPAKPEVGGGSKLMQIKKEQTSPKTVFLSYSWDDKKHKAWVKQLSRDLCADGRIHTILDEKDLVLGDPIPQFMEQSIVNSEYVIIICTPKYKEKADNRTGGVGYEDSIISAELYNLNNHRKYIPVLARGTWKDSIPIWAKGKLGVDMTNPTDYSEGLEKLKMTIVKGKK